MGKNIFQLIEKGHVIKEISVIIDEFIPLVKLITNKNQNNYDLIHTEEYINLSKHIDKNKRNPNLQQITTDKQELALSFKIEKGIDYYWLSDFVDDDGYIEPKLSISDEGVKIVSETKLLKKFGDELEVKLKFDTKEKKEFYLDFYANDNEDYFNKGEYTNVHCGRVKIFYNRRHLKKMYYAISLMQKTNYRSNNIKVFKKFVKVKNSSFGDKELKNYFIQESKKLSNDKNNDYDGEEIHFLAIFSHGITDQIFGDACDDIDKMELKSMLTDQNIKFSTNALIYLGACNAGTKGIKNSFAQELADITNASVIAMVDDGVAPIKESLSKDKRPIMSYGPKMGDLKNGKFHKFQKGKLPIEIGKHVDILKLIDQQKNNE